MKHLGTKVLETDRLILRPLTMEDAEEMFHNWCSDPEVTKYLTWPTHPDVSITKDILKEWIPLYQNKDFYQWGIVLKGKDKDTLIGSISVVHHDDRIQKVTTGYCIGQKWWHQGITPEALKRMIEFFFNEVGVNRIEAYHDTKNPNSGAVMRKAGMKFEGILRQNDLNNTGIVDEAIYGILRSDWLDEKS